MNRSHKQKWYAVRQGYKTGLFTTWEECQKSIRGFKGAQFKSFTSQEDAIDYMHQQSSSKGHMQSDNPVESTKKKKDSPYVLCTVAVDGTVTKYEKTDVESLPDCMVYTDGSADLIADAAGSGVYFGCNDARNTYFSVPGKQTNQRAEVWAVIQALRLTKGDIIIGSDSLYAMHCSSKLWQAKSNLDLYDMVWKEMQGRHITFIYTPSHETVVGNNEADKLAKKAMSQKRSQNREEQKK